MLKNVLLDRRIWLLGATLILVVVVARWTLDQESAFQAVNLSGYWFTLALVVFALRAIGRVVRQAWKEARWTRFDGVVLAGILLCSAIWTAQERPGFKILADEVLLLGTSMGMHYERVAAYPIRATDVQGPFQILDKVLDKRPLLFPFLVATVHDLTGYRPENPFYVNMAFGAGFLALVYVLGWRLADNRWGGVVVGLLFAGLPLLAQQSTGGGFDLLNLFLIGALVLLTAGYLRQPDAPHLEALVFGALLLASTRYESVIFLLPTAAAAWLGWARSQRVVMSWPLCFSPVFLFPILLQNRIFSGASAAWEMQSIEGITKPFSPDYVVDNLGHALAFFFDFSGYQPSSALFGAAGLLAVPFFVLWIIRVLRAPGQTSAFAQATAIVGIGLLGVTCVHLFYFWGQFDHPLIRRLSLPVHLLMALGIVVVLTHAISSVRGWRMAAGIAFAALMLQGLPTMARQAYAASYTPGVETAMRRAFLATREDTNFLAIDNDSVFWITHHVPATPAKQANARKEGLVYHLRNHSFSDMFVFQSVFVDAETGERSVDPEDDLGPDFELETVWERRVQVLLFARISRVKAIREGDTVLAAAAPFVTSDGPKKSADELAEQRARYLETWLKKLP